METKKLIQELRAIKFAVIANASDTLWMTDGNETVCEAIDGILSKLGVPGESLEFDYAVPTKEHSNNCAKCGTRIRAYFLKDGICNGCRNPHLVVEAVTK